MLLHPDVQSDKKAAVNDFFSPLLPPPFIFKCISLAYTVSVGRFSPTHTFV